MRFYRLAEIFTGFAEPLYFVAAAAFIQVLEYGEKDNEVVAILIAAVVAVYAVWSFFQPEEQVKYLTETVKRGNIHQTVSATGEISPSNLVTVGSQASGQIKKLYVKLGQQVKKGDLIAEINSTTQVNTLNTEKSKLETYQAKLVSAEIALNSAEKKI